jgi:hypothetical protein
MKVVCIDSRINFFSKNPNKWQKGEELTMYKTYDIMSEDVLGKTYFIKNDLGKCYDYNKTRFITLDEWRRIQLKELGI